MLSWVKTLLACTAFFVIAFGALLWSGTIGFQAEALATDEGTTKVVSHVSPVNTSALCRSVIVKIPFLIKSGRSANITLTIQSQTIQGNSQEGLLLDAIRRCNPDNDVTASRDVKHVLINVAHGGRVGARFEIPSNDEARVTFRASKHGVGTISGHLSAGDTSVELGAAGI